MRYNKTVFIFILIILYYEFSTVTAGNNQRGRNNRGNQNVRQTENAQKTTNKQGKVNKREAKGKELPDAESKKNWEFNRSPRAGVLYIKTHSGKTLYPGILNCGRNRLRMDEFDNNLTIKFPSARTGALYTLVIYEDDFLVKAMANVQGEDLYKGDLTGKGYNVAEFIDLDESPLEQIFYTEVFEQIGPIPQATYDRKGWMKILASWKKLLHGTAGKTCFIIKPNNPAAPSETKHLNDITLLFQQFNINLNVKKVKTQFEINVPKIKASITLK